MVLEFLTSLTSNDSIFLNKIHEIVLIYCFITILSVKITAITRVKNTKLTFKYIVIIFLNSLTIYREFLMPNTLNQT